MKKIYSAIIFLLISFTGFAQLPSYTATVFDTSSTGYYFLCPIQISGIPVPLNLLILDRNGDPVYYKPLSGPNTNITNFTLQPNRLMSYYLANKFYLMDSTFAIVDSVSCKNGYHTDAHEFRILQNGHYLLLGDEIVVMDLSSYPYFNHNGTIGSTTASVRCAIIQELDANKNVVFEWHAKDYFAFDDVDIYWMSSPKNVDWTHSNAIEADQDGNILLSSRMFNEITKINRSDSTIMWRFGGKRNQFTFLSDTVPFYGQHDVRRINNGHVTLFDDGRHSVSHGSRAVEYQLDEVNKTADLKWSYIYDSTMNSTAMGSFQRLSNSNSLVNFGILASNNVCFVVVDSLGSQVFKITFNDTLSSYRAFNYPTLPWQFQRPKIKCIRGSVANSLDAGAGYASYLWSNGSTTQAIPIYATGTYSVFVSYVQGGYISSEKYIVSDFSNPCSATSSISENNIVKGDINIYPNPTDETLNITYDLAEASSVNIILMDISGRIILQQKSNLEYPGKHSVSINISNVAPGIYLLKLNQQVLKFMKQ